MGIRSVTDERGGQAPRLSLKATRRGERNLPANRRLTVGSACVLTLGSLLVAGCGESAGYPEHVKYSTREDRIVVRVPNVEVDDLEPAGELDAHLAQIDTKGGQTFDPMTLAKEARNRVQETLTLLFGTPAKPRVTGSAAIDAEAQTFGLEPAALARGSVLFRRHCQQCHGVHGDGRGPTGLWIQPHPRDFRAGKFKYVTSRRTGSGKPSRDDLRRTLRTGLKGTPMPSFAQIPDDDRETILSYVIHLSIRGQVERQLLLDLMEAEGGDLHSRAELLLGKYLAEWNPKSAPAEAERGTPQWVASDFADGKPNPDAVRRGYALFTDLDGVGCLKCHIDFGRKAKYRYDDWGTLVKPMDLTLGVYRGGDTAEDHYHRVRWGIAPSGMPSVEKLNDDQIRDLLHFVRALPFPNKLPEGVRERIYPD